jgi:hypothetical protein
MHKKHVQVNAQKQTFEVNALKSYEGKCSKICKGKCSENHAKVNATKPGKVYVQKELLR